MISFAVIPFMKRIVNYFCLVNGPSHESLGQCLYRNVHVHDDIAGVTANARKEEIQQFIEDQLELGEEGLDEKDQYLLEVNLEDLEFMSGEEQHYWLLHIQAARQECALRGTHQQRSSCTSQRRERA